MADTLLPLLLYYKVKSVGAGYVSPCNDQEEPSSEHRTDQFLESFQVQPFWIEQTQQKSSW